jgi:hypothetical protein
MVWVTRTEFIRLVVGREPLVVSAGPVDEPAADQDEDLAGGDAQDQAVEGLYRGRLVGQRRLQRARQLVRHGDAFRVADDLVERRRLAEHAGAALR